MENLSSFKAMAVKLIASAALTSLVNYTHMLATPIMLLFLVMFVDWVCGMAKAYQKSEWNSKVGIRGIVKKIGYIGGVIVAAVFDWLIYSGLKSVGISFDSSFYFGMIVTIWLIINECISILENLDELGTPLPKWLIKGLRKIKTSIDTKNGESNNNDIDGTNSMNGKV